MRNSNLPHGEDESFFRSQENNLVDDEFFDMLTDIPEESISIFTGESVDLNIRISNDSFNTPNVKRQSLKLYSMLKSSLDDSMWKAFVSLVVTDPETIASLFGGNK